MSKYTTQVRHICDSLANMSESSQYYNTAETIELARPLIFNFDYPIFDNNYKKVLETKIIKRYYTREIGEETYGLWKFRLDTRLNEIMPFYNKLYESELLEFNPFYDVDVTTSRNIEGTGNTDKDGTRKDVTTGTNGSVGNVTSSDNGSIHDVSVDSREDWDLHSDTPQGSISKIKNSDNMYLTDAKNMTKDGTVTSDSESSNRGVVDTVVDSTINRNLDGSFKENSIMNTTENYLETVKGKRGGQSYMELLLKYRKTFINIDMMILEDLSDLFMNLW